MTEQTAPLSLILRGMTGTVVVAGPRGRVELRVGGVLDVDVPVLLLVDLVVLAAGHGETLRVPRRLVGRKDGEGRLPEGGRQNDAAGAARPSRPIGAGDETSGGEGGGHVQIDLVGLAGGRDAKAADADAGLVVLGLFGGPGDVGGPVDRDTGPAVVGGCPRQELHRGEHGEEDGGSGE